MKEMFQKQEQIQHMWSDVPPEVFEVAPSSTGLFEREEIGIIGEAVADIVSPTGAELLLLGSATAFRELQAVNAASEIREQFHFSRITAVDIAPHFLAVAARRLRESTITDTYSVQQRSLDDVYPLIISSPGPVMLGIYDANCLMSDDKESNGEAVGLDEYGEGMREILGPNTSILPLFYKDFAFREGDAIVAYESPNDYEAMRERLRKYSSEHPSLVGFRVQINKPGDTNSLFMSTWFDVEKMAEIARKYGFQVSLRRGESRKGAVLVLEREQDTKNAMSCTLVMNNVIGNLATPEQMTQFFTVLKNLGSQTRRRGI